MRIIAGTHRGRTLLGPADDQTTRPITDRVKEALFNRLHSLGVLGYGRVLDVFAGTGSMGLEALSRGAEHCVFVERDRDAADRLRRNLDTLGIDAARAAVRQTDALAGVWHLPLEDASVTLVFLDPPYPQAAAGLGPFEPLLTDLRARLEPGGVTVVRTPAETAVGALDGYDGPFSATYGGMGLHFYQRPLPNEPGSPPDS